MKKKTIIIRYRGETVKYRYAISKAANVCVIHMEQIDEEWDEVQECEIVIALFDGWYYIAFPDMGTASAGYSNINNYGTVADIVYDAGFDNPDTEAITQAILDVAKSGF